MSAKTSNQPGRRTPLSLTGGYSKGGQAHHNKGGGGGSGGNSTHSSNGHSNYHKQDNNKNQQNNKTDQQQQTNAQTTTTSAKFQNKKDHQNVGTNTESKIPKPQQQNQNSSADNAKFQKQQNQNNKNQQHQQQQQQQQQANGVTNNQKNTASQTNKEKQQNEKEIKTNEKTNKKSEAVSQEKPEAMETVIIDDGGDENEKNKEAQEKSEKIEETTDKKEEELKKPIQEANNKELKIETENKKEENSSENKTANVAENESHVKQIEKENKENPSEQMEVVDEISAPAVPLAQEQPQKEEVQMTAPPTPKSLRSSKPSTPNKPTPTKAEKTPQKSPPTKREVTTCIDDFEMEPLNVEGSPSKEEEAPEPKDKIVAESAPCATSTPGKLLLHRTTAKTDVQLAMQSSGSPERPLAFSQISGRRAIRPITDYTPSKFQSNIQFRESYRRINTELDATNTSMNVTVGSEIPNNSSFSFFSRGRKRERTPPQHSQSAIGELQTTEMDISPPKRARLDFFSVVSSPLSLLRNRFSKASLQSSTPVKLQQKMEEKEDDIEVQNVSGVSVHEDFDKTAEGLSEYGTEDTSIAIEANDDSNPMPLEDDFGSGDKELSQKMAGGDKKITDDGDIKITETPLQTGSGDAAVKNKRCIVM